MNRSPSQSGQTPDHHMMVHVSLDKCLVMIFIRYEKVTVSMLSQVSKSIYPLEPNRRVDRVASATFLDSSSECIF